MATDEDHPLKVYYPGGGKFMVLHWSADDVRGHLAMAPTEDKLRDIAKVLFTKRIGVEIKAVCEIEIVAPSRRLRVLAVEHHMREEIEGFHRELVGRMREVLRAGKPLPAPFAVCENFQFPEGMELPNEDEEDRRCRLDCHYYCVNCVERVRLVGVTPRELYTKYRTRWRQLYPERSSTPIAGKGVPVPRVSYAPEASNDEPLWYAEADFGHHAEGATLHEIGYKDHSSDYRPACVGGNVIFFFRRLRELDALAAEITVLRNASDAAWEAERERERVAWRVAWQSKREEPDDVDRALAFFQGAES